MIGSQVGITLHHRPGPPTAQALQLMRRRYSLSLPGGPGMPQIVPAEILDAHSAPSFRIGRNDRLAPERRMLTHLLPQHAERNIVQWHRNGMTILRLRPGNPSMPQLQIHLVPFEP